MPKEEQGKRELVEQIACSLLNEKYHCADMIRSHLLVKTKSAKKVYPKSRTLDQMELSNRRLRELLVSGEVSDIQEEIENRKVVSEQLERELKMALPGHSDRLFKPRALKESFPEPSLNVLRAVGEMGVANTALLSTKLSQTRQAIFKYIKPLVFHELLNETSIRPLLGKRRWEFMYSLSPLGKSTFSDRFGYNPKTYSYDVYKMEHVHHLITNYVSLYLEGFVPWGHYYGFDAEKINIRFPDNGKPDIYPDIAGNWHGDILYVEIEVGGLSKYPWKLSKYVQSDAEHLITVVFDHDAAKEYEKLINSMVNKRKRKNPITFYLSTLEGVVKGTSRDITTIKGAPK